MCGKNDTGDLFEFLGFQEALKISQESKSNDTTLDIFHIESDDKTKKIISPSVNRILGRGL